MRYPSQSMSFDDYQQLAMSTKSPKNTLIIVGLGLCGEAGEVADIIKKIEAHGHELDVNVLIKEVGDVLWYCALAADVLGVSLSDIAEANIAKLKARYPNGFDSNRSKNR